MQIDGDITNVEGFQRAYNDVIQQLMNHYGEAGDRETKFGLQAWMVIRQVPFKQSFAGVTVELRPMASQIWQFILHCDNPEITPYFEQFWIECERRWGALRWRPTTQALIEPAGIESYLNDSCVQRGDPIKGDAWWNAFFDWVMAYRAQRGRVLTYQAAADSIHQTLATFKYQLKKWEIRTERERDTKS